ncbi:hypothetical protein ACFQ46_00780 [Kineococcus sp. GCM10028916]|uniref:hypothetical protein n=1 Tax=Kineococcus sp. GCM10028916 TaxID=3273394 RepID=UPI003645C89D
MIVIRRFARVHNPGRTDDEGFALMGVVMFMMVMLLVCSVVVAAVVQGATFQRKQQDWNAALAAAQAGVDDYISRLNTSNGGYYQYNGVTTIDPTNGAMGTNPNGSLKYQKVSTDSASSFHYTADTTAYVGSASVSQTGNIVVTSTGRVGTRERTLRSTVGRKGFLAYLYFSEYETVDPALKTQTDVCTNWLNSRSDGQKHLYDGRPSSCTGIQFASDTLDGPVHSNDTILICNNVTFKGPVTTASPLVSGTRYYRNYDPNSTCTTNPAPVFQAGEPSKITSIPVPDSNQSLKDETAATSNPRGCLYVGPTTITLNGNTMFVHSPWTKSTASGCTLDQWITIPANGTVYVDDRPANGVVSDPNSWTTATEGTVRNLCGSAGNPVGYPVAGEATGSSAYAWSRYSCTDGDVFIQELNGQAANGLAGRLTVGSAGSIYITDNLDYASNNAMLGLIANNNVWYWHGLSSSGTNLNLPAKTFPTQAAKNAPLQNPTVSAAMVALSASIGTMNSAYGAGLGTLTIKGALAQLYRGVVRQGTTGYAKKYSYDKRLIYDAPPHFLNPQTSTFVTKLSAELPGYAPTQ